MGGDGVEVAVQAVAGEGRDAVTVQPQMEIMEQDGKENQQEPVEIEPLAVHRL